MEFVQLKKTLQTKLGNAYIIYGDDNYVLAKAYGLILNRLNITMPELNEYKFDSDTIDLEDVTRALLTLPMMSDKKMVYVNAVHKPKIINIDKLLDYFDMPNDSSVLVINAGENVKDWDKLKNVVEYVDCSRLKIDVLKSVIVNEFAKANKQITGTAIAKLCDYTLNDLSTISNEIIKLSNYVEGSVVNDSDVDAIVTKSFEFQIYELSEALARKQSDRCFEIISSLKDKKDNIKLILPTISNHFRRLFYIVISDNSILELATMLGVKEYAVKKGIEQSKLFTKRQLKEIVDSFAELDFETKSSEISLDNAIDYIVLKILNL